LISPNLSQDHFDGELLPALGQMHEWKIQCFRTDYFDFADKSPFPGTLKRESHHRVLAQEVESYHPDLPYFDRAFLCLMHML
ncbi:hypothetical protein ABTE96_22165, partial [Acinetobacter baumannii]